MVGGSLGATALNELVPKALALIPAAVRPQVTHQSGARQIDALRAHYQAAGVQADCTPFIEAFLAKREHRDLVGDMPIHLTMAEDLGLRGALALAAQR